MKTKYLAMIHRLVSRQPKSKSHDLASRLRPQHISRHAAAQFNTEGALQADDPLQGTIDHTCCKQELLQQPSAATAVCGGDQAEPRAREQSGDMQREPLATKCSGGDEFEEDAPLVTGLSKLGHRVSLPTGAVDSSFDAASAFAALERAIWEQR